MPEIQKISIALTGEQVSALRAAVDAGEYATTSEVVREAIRDWQFRRQIRQDDARRFREMWAEGKASGTPVAADFENVKRRGRKRAEQARGR